MNGEVGSPRFILKLGMLMALECSDLNKKSVSSNCSCNMALFLFEIKREVMSCPADFCWNLLKIDCTLDMLELFYLLVFRSAELAWSAI